MSASVPPPIPGVQDRRHYQIAVELPEATYRWEFQITHTEEGSFLAIPVCGPTNEASDDVQKQWTNQTFLRVPGFKEIWDGDWTLNGIAVQNVERQLSQYGRLAEWNIRTPRLSEVPDILRRRPEALVEEEISLNSRTLPDTGDAKISYCMLLLKSSFANDLYAAWAYVKAEDSDIPRPSVWFQNTVGGGIGPAPFRSDGAGRAMDGVRLSAAGLQSLLNSALNLPPESLTTFVVTWVLQ